MNIVEMLDAMSTPPAPAPEVITLDHLIIETILAELEAADPLRSVVTGLRAALAAPRPELWVMFTPGPNETYAFASKEDAEQAAADLIAVGQRLKADRIARGESVEFWREWRAEVIPSPWEPDEHFEVMALEQQDDAKSLRAMAVDSAAEIEALKAEAAQLRQHNAALRQQLADVTNERDGLREGFSHQAKLVAEDQETIESLEGRLDASEARNSEAAELLREASKSIIRHQAEQPMSRRLSGLLTKTRTAINKHLAQAAPAAGEQREAL